MTREPYLIGYARVSKGDGQSNVAQRRALNAAGCKRVFEETANGGRWDRPKSQKERTGSMIGYVTLGMNNVEAARAYYDELLGSIGASRLLEQGEEANFVTMYATSFEAPRIVITCPFDGGAASPGNGNMVAIERPTRADVDAFHAKALKLGGTDEGAPGLRGPDGPQAFYAAYFRDPEGNKLAAFCIGPDH